MMEIVFSQSALGSMKCGWSQLRGKLPSSGLPWDGMYAFSLALSVGGISEDTPGEARRAALRELCRCNASIPGFSERLEQRVEDAAASLEEVLRRSAEGEPARIWYSRDPDERCGFHWMMAQLDRLKDKRGPVSTVKLPLYEQRDNGTLVEHLGWGGVCPENWGKFLPLEQPASSVLIRAAAARWRELQEEDAPLRAVVNGRLASVPEDFYDHFIRRELARTPEEFREAHLIGGNVLGRYQLGIGDGFVANRVEAMIASGELEAVTQAAEGEASYRRVLRKKM